MQKFQSMLLCLIGFPIAAFTQEQPLLQRSAEDEQAAKSRSAECGRIEPIPLPDMRFTAGGLDTYRRKAGRIQANSGVVASVSMREILFEREHAALRIDAAGRNAARETPPRSLAPEALLAIEQSPAWLEDALRLKFSLLAAKRLDAGFAQLIIDAEHRLKDEVAFVIAHSSMQTLTDTRFSQDREMIIRNAEMIYRYADSLRYVRLVEHGDPGSRDRHTTTAYRIYDPSTQDTIWSEIPRDIYYWHIVHPKMDQEGVYVRDNFNDNSGQRTYGYAWRDYIWNNPDPAHDYKPVNITTTKGTVASIQRFGELMRTPTYLWDRRKTYLPFNRPFQPGQSALDVLGNWASRALPVDVVLPRAFQPNQILMKHNGMCNEDAFLVAGACRTALIPIVYAGCYGEDHVFGMIWDDGWHHFEFFRGGLAPSGNQFYGITNMLDRGSYGWKISMVEGTRPDGYPLNLTRHYTGVCDVELLVTDTLGNPMGGAMVQLYAPYGGGYRVCHRLFTGADGKLLFEAGEEKRYLINAFHPMFGWSPADSTRAYYMTAANTVAGQKYTVTVPFPNVRLTRPAPAVQPPSGTAAGAIRLRLRAKDIRTGVNPHDGQRSRFHEQDSSGGALVSLTLLDADNYTAFKEGRAYTALSHTPSTAAGEWFLNVPMDRVYYALLSNEAAANIFTDIQADCELLDEPISGVEETIAESGLEIWPNPAANSFRLNMSDATEGRLSVYNALGVRVLEREVSNGDNVDISYLPDGTYVAVLHGAEGGTRRSLIMKIAGR